MDTRRKASAAPAGRVGDGGSGQTAEVGKGKGKLSQVWGVKKKSITRAQFHESLKKEAAEQVGRRALERKQDIVDKAKELRRRDSPKKKDVLREPLPANLLLLEKYFECLEAASSLLRTRRKMCTFSAVAKTVENMTGRRFSMKHLAQIKYIYPEVLGLELVSHKDADTSKIIRDVKVTLLQISPDAAAAARDGSQGKEGYRSMQVSRKEKFRAKLLAHLKAHPGVEDVPEAAVPQHFPVTAPDGDLLARQGDPSSPKSPSEKFGEEDKAAGAKIYELPPIRRVNVPFDMERKVNSSVVAGELEIAAAREEEVERTRLSFFSPLFKPFFSLRPSEDNPAELSLPVAVGEEQAAAAGAGESEALTDALVPHRDDSPQPSAVTEQTESVLKGPRDVMRKLNFSFTEKGKQVVTEESEKLDNAPVLESASSSMKASLGAKPSTSGFKVPRDVPRKLVFSSPAGEKQTVSAAPEGLDTDVLQVGTLEGPSSLAEPMKANLSSPARLEKPVASGTSAPQSGAFAGQPGELTPVASRKSDPEATLSFQFCQTPETSPAKNPFLRTGPVQSSVSPFFLRPCNAAKSGAAAAAEGSCTPSSSTGVPCDASPVPGTPYQPSPFAGYSQHFISREAAVDASASQAQVKPTSSTPVRPQTAARFLRFGTPGPAHVPQKSGPDNLSVAGAGAAEPGSAAEKGVASIEPATPARSVHVLEQAESPCHVRSIRGDLFGCASMEPMGCCMATPAGPSCCSASPSCCSTPQVFEKVGALLQSTPATSPVTPQHLHTPKRSRQNVGLYFDQEDAQGQDFGNTFPSPSKKPHTASAQEQVQVGMQRRVGGKLAMPEPVSAAECGNEACGLPPCAPTAAPSLDPAIVKCLPTRLVQMVREKERKALEDKSRGVVEMRKLAQMKADLPKLFSTVRQIFQGRSVLPHDDLISKVVYSNLGLKDTVEVEERVKLLLDLAPDWISVKTSSTGDRLYRVSKTANVVSVRKRIAGPG